MFEKVFKAEDGFTLIELLMVIAVLGILVGIVVPRVTDITEDAEIAAARADLRNTINALEQKQASLRLERKTLGDDNGDGETYFEEVISELQDDGLLLVAEWDDTDDTYVVAYNYSTNDDGTEEEINDDDKIAGSIYYITSESNAIKTDDSDITAISDLEE